MNPVGGNNQVRQIEPSTQEVYYVVWWEERLQDGTETGAKVVLGIKEAERVASLMIKDPVWNQNTTVRVFQLGKEIPLTIENAEERVVTKTIRKVVLDQE